MARVSIGAAAATAAAASLRGVVASSFIKHGGPQGMKAYALDVIEKHKLDGTLYVYDLGNVVRLYRAWKSALPRVEPFYAIKSNPDINLLRILKSLGAGFDCASKSELDRVLSLSLGRPNDDDIIFAHPCKPRSDILHAAERGIQLTTFDTESELEKIAEHAPVDAFECILRIRADDPDARIPLGLKYGAQMEEVPRLLRRARDLKLRVSGVSFHVGSGGCMGNGAAFRGAISASRHVFDLAAAEGFEMELLDIGGGFTGRFDADGDVEWGEVASTINSALDEEFPKGKGKGGVRIIAEPGRYFSETSAVLFCPVTGQRTRAGHVDYFLTDGLYGSFNCMLYDGQVPSFEVLRSPLLPEAVDVDVDAAALLHPSTLWGPTCDSADVVYKDILLPKLRNQDWLMFPNAGAYTIAGACDFNGINMTKPEVRYVFSESPVDDDDALALAHFVGS